MAIVTVGSNGSDGDRLYVWDVLDRKLSDRFRLSVTVKNLCVRVEVRVGTAPVTVARKGWVVCV